MQSYSPRVALITGSVQGIGYSIAHRLADEGVDIALNDIASKQERLSEVVEEIKRKGRRCIAVVADVTSEQEVKDMIAKVSVELGSLDIMIANAGIAPGASFLETTSEQLDAVIAVNLRGVFLCYQHAAHQMIKEGHGGRIIGKNCASSAAGKEGATYISAYSATKFAVRGLTQSAAKELGSHGITVNAYAPGIIITPMLNSAVPDPDKTDEQRLAETKVAFGLAANCPDAGPEVIASMVAYLCKPEAYFITGQTLSVDGGIRFS